MHICHDIFLVVSLNSQSKGEKCSSRWERKELIQPSSWREGSKTQYHPTPPRSSHFLNFLLLKHNLLIPKIPKNVRLHSGNSIENATLFFSPSKNASS